MKRVSLAIGLVALVEMLLLWRLAQRTSLVFAGAYLLLAAATGIAVIAQAARQALGRAPQRTPRTPASSSERLWIMLAGVLLIVPGVLSDLAALVLLAPPGRALVRRWLGPRLRGWVSTSSIPSGAWARFNDVPGSDASPAADEHTIDVTSRPVASRQRVSSPKR